MSSYNIRIGAKEYFNSIGNQFHRKGKELLMENKRKNSKGVELKIQESCKRF